MFVYTEYTSLFISFDCVQFMRAANSNQCSLVAAPPSEQTYCDYIEKSILC